MPAHNGIALPVGPSSLPVVFLLTIPNRRPSRVHIAIAHIDFL